MPTDGVVDLGSLKAGGIAFDEKSKEAIMERTTATHALSRRQFLTRLTSIGALAGVAARTIELITADPESAAYAAQIRSLLA
ncbi:MAG: twin-arginine translocation signal domain-containing protein [Caldilinea sp. CFX5]|nr:twin-arginine translocation signal domain-containing protein [Caldilinea sp. CFX5]